MSPETVIATGHQALEVTIAMLLVLLVPALIVGVLVSMFQAATQINEMTLSFIPKLLVTFVVLMLAGPWLLRVITNYAERLMGNIPYIIG